MSNDLVESLKAGDSKAFAQVVGQWSPAMIRVARLYVSTDASAEEVAQEAWLAVVKGIGNFDGRSLLKTWVFRIVTNIARTRGVKEHRSQPTDFDKSVPTVDVSRFQSKDDAAPGAWREPPLPWPEQAVLSAELRDVVEEGLRHLPDAQRSVVELRDLHGFGSDEVCEFLMLTPENQRVLLHRGRAGLRTAIERYFGAVDMADG